MLSKLVGVFAVTALLTLPTAVDAHPRHNHNHRVKVHTPAPAVVVTLGWTWIEASLIRPAHWSHPHYGRSHRAYHAGPPPARPHARAVWVPGHWERRGRHNRVWVNGHWSVRR